MHVVRLGLASTKGTRHLAREQVELDGHGPVGDRSFCLVDVTRQRVLRTVQHRSLLALSARWDGTELALELPDGTFASGTPTPTGEHLTCDYWGRSVTHELTTGPHSEVLSAYVGKEVRLAASPRGGIVYGAPVSLVSLASLRDVAARAGRSDVADSAARFRMTMVVDAGDEPYAEDQWVGRDLRVGAAVIRVEGPVPRCGVIDLDPATGAKDGTLLTVLAGFRPGTGGEPWLGVDATVVEPGVVRRGAGCALSPRPDGGRRPDLPRP